MSEYLSVYIVAPSRDQAETIAHRLVEEKLAACANILSPVHSIYRWKGEIETADEVALIVKTRSALYAALEKRVKALHSYECPCIVAWPIGQGFAPYLSWIGAETQN